MAIKENKYYPLYKYLKASDRERVVLTLSQMQKILGFSLPKSSTMRTWWANDISGHAQARGWVDAGYSVRLEDEGIVFKKNAFNHY